MEVSDNTQPLSFFAKWVISRKLKKGYFKKLMPDLVYRSHGLEVKCPSKLRIIRIVKSDYSGYEACLVNMKWYKALKDYNEFEKEMEKAIGKLKFFYVKHNPFIERRKP